MKTVFRLVGDGDHRVTYLEKAIQESALLATEPLWTMQEQTYKPPAIVYDPEARPKELSEQDWKDARERKPAAVAKVREYYKKHNAIDPYNAFNALERPFPVAEPVWEAAQRGKADAIAQVNRDAPGSIYRNPIILEHIIQHTAIALGGVYCVEESKQWLDTALKVFAPSSKRVQLNDSLVQAVADTLSEVVMIRHVYQSPPNISVPARKSRLSKVFPEVAQLHGNTYHGADRRDWVSVIFRLPDKEGLVFPPVEAAIRIVSDITGYKRASFYRKLKFLPSWRTQIRESKELGKLWAKDILDIHNSVNL